MKKITSFVLVLLFSQVASAEWIGSRMEDAKVVSFSKLSTEEKELVRKHVILTATVYQNALQKGIAELLQMIGPGFDLNRPLYEMNEKSYDVFKKYTPGEFYYPCHDTICNDVEFSRARGYSTPAEIYGSIYEFSEHIYAANYKDGPYVNRFFDKSLEIRRGGSGFFAVQLNGTQKSEETCDYINVLWDINTKPHFIAYCD